MTDTLPQPSVAERAAWYLARSYGAADHKHREEIRRQQLTIERQKRVLRAQAAELRKLRGPRQPYDGPVKRYRLDAHVEAHDLDDLQMRLHDLARRIHEHVRLGFKGPFSGYGGDVTYSVTIPRPDLDEASYNAEPMAWADRQAEIRRAAKAEDEHIEERSLVTMLDEIPAGEPTMLEQLRAKQAAS